MRRLLAVWGRGRGAVLALGRSVLRLLLAVLCWGRGSVLALGRAVLRLLAVRCWGRSSVLALGRTVLWLLLAVRRLLAVWGRGRGAVLALGSTVGCLGGGQARSLLVLGVIAGVNGAEEELAQPQVGGEVEGRVRARHLVLLDLEVGGGVDELADAGLVVELAEELARLQVVADLRELEGDGALAVGAARELVGGVADRVEDGGGGLAGGLAVGDGDDEDGLAELVRASFLHDEGLEDLVAELGAHGR